jgi:predicted TIM-barrel fold metal-dependent hydrolase
VRRPGRVVDAHVHLWDPVRTDWYPYLSGRRDLGLGDTTAMARRFDVAAHRAESIGWNVEKLVNVAAAVGRHSIDETLELDRRAEVEGGPNAIIGGLPAADTIGTAEAIGLVDRQMAAARFRGVRPMGTPSGPLPPPDVLGALQDRRLVFELMTHPDELVTAARGLEPFPDLVVVVEHTGWPRSDGEEERRLWLEGMRALAALGDGVHCKLSGLAMPFGAMSAEAFAPWIEPAIEAFGVERCLFASNFPVDGVHGTFDELYTAYAEVTEGLDDDARGRLFASNAERVYRC